MALPLTVARQNPNPLAVDVCKNFIVKNQAATRIDSIYHVIHLPIPPKTPATVTIINPKTSPILFRNRVMHALSLSLWTIILSMHTLCCKVRWQLRPHFNCDALNQGLIEHYILFSRLLCLPDTKLSNFAL